MHSENMDNPPQPGYDLDAWIALHVMGFTLLTPRQTDRLQDVHDGICIIEMGPHFGLMRYYEESSTMWQMKRWHPSTDIVAAWEVIERFKHPSRYEQHTGFWNRLNVLSMYEHSASEMAYQICLAAYEAMQPSPSWDDIRKRFGRYFDGIDADEFVRELRED